MTEKDRTRKTFQDPMDLITDAIDSAEKVRRETLMQERVMRIQTAAIENKTGIYSIFL
jgi:hypothetical protein